MGIPRKCMRFYLPCKLSVYSFHSTGMPESWVPCCTIGLKEAPIARCLICFLFGCIGCHCCRVYGCCGVAGAAEVDRVGTVIGLKLLEQRCTGYKLLRLRCEVEECTRPYPIRALTRNTALKQTTLQSQ